MLFLSLGQAWPKGNVHPLFSRGKKKLADIIKILVLFAISLDHYSIEIVHLLRHVLISNLHSQLILFMHL